MNVVAIFHVRKWLRFCLFTAITKRQLSLYIVKLNSLCFFKLKKRKNSLLLHIFLFTLTACSSPNTPAPVVEISKYISVKNTKKHHASKGITGDHYIVKKGETLYSIAWRANSDFRQLAKLNNISVPYKIFPGQKLFLSTNPLQASNNKRSVKKSTKSTNLYKNNSTKKPIASNKKQAYGEKVGKIKPRTKPVKFSQKISDWRWPVKGRVIKWFSNAPQGNKGIDIAGRKGTKIKSAAKGKVVYAGNALRGYGKLVIIKHNNDYLSAYAHNDKIFVKEQQLINTGDIIASMGNTDSEKVKLHFEVRFRGKSVNPMKYLPKKQ